MRVVYPVLFYEESKDSYSAFVPDLDYVSTCGESLEKVLYMAEDLIAGVLLDYLEDGNKLPKSSNIDKISFKSFEKEFDMEDIEYISKFKTYVAVDLSKYAEKWNKKLVKKTVNIPMWLNTKAEELKINFSKTLEEALLEKMYK